MQRSKTLTWIEILSSLGILCILAAVVLPALVRAQVADRGASCQNNLKQIGIAFKMYAQENEGHLYPRGFVPYSKDYDPALPLEAGYDTPSVYPQYINDPSVGVCPAAKEDTSYISEGKVNWGYGEGWAGHPAYKGAGTRSVAINCNPPNNPDDSCFPMFGLNLTYTYWGWSVCTQQLRTDSDYHCAAEAFGPAGDNVQRRLDQADKDFTLTMSSGPATFHRLREGIERFFVTDTNAASTAYDYQCVIPIMYDSLRPFYRSSGPFQFNHPRNVINVLFMDGHVESARFPAPNNDVCFMASREAIRNGDATGFP